MAKAKETPKSKGKTPKHTASRPVTAAYSNIQKEETLKAQVFRDFFSKSKFAYEPDTGNIDFIVTDAKLQKDSIFKHHFLWAEAKKGIQEIDIMFTQLVLTLKNLYDKGDQLPPPFIGCFDTEKIAFVPFHDILPIFSDNDVNWNTTPSNHTSAGFLKTKKMVEKLIKNNLVIFNFATDKKEIENFINNNLIAGNITAKFKINKNNFVIIYNKWLEKVKKTIAIDWNIVKKSGIIDGDFFLADILSKENYTLKDKLFVILMNNQYKFDKKFDEAGFSLYKEVGFNDNQKAHIEFWSKYERPPQEEYWDYIVNRRDLLVPQDIRERKGSFFTPKQWVELSQQYISDTLGIDWQDDYYVWDCAAGTGNLLAGLTNKYNIWASTLDKADVDVMKDRIKNGANLLEDHVFQFDFLNDDFTKLPKGLQDIINSDKKRKRLVIYINPPYAEASNVRTLAGGKEGNRGVEQSKINNKYGYLLGQGKAEIFVQFFTRIYQEINGCILAEFSKLKIISGQHFIDFRKFFLAEMKRAFVCPANTFDNVKGRFPIGFFIWDTSIKKRIGKVKTDVYNADGEKIGKKTFFSYDNSDYINDWIKPFRGKKEGHNIGKFPFKGNDFQNQKLIAIVHPDMDYNVEAGQFLININNVIAASVYFAVRKVIPANWLNDRDQFLYPDSNWENDTEFQNDCFTYMVFNNNIQSKYGTNHWIPFTETDVNSRTNFDSHFMSDFIRGKLQKDGYNDLFSELEKKYKALKFSKEAKTVFKAGKKLWQYYHSQPTANTNAGLYDIREFFQGRDDNGKMNNKSGDDYYNELISDLRSALKELALKIQPKVYEYGFLSG